MEKTSAASTEKVCYLHIGPHKTGTTSIQTALFRQADALATRGLHYPKLADFVTGKLRSNHTPLCRAANLRAADLREAPYWSGLSTALETLEGSIVISTEHFAEALIDRSRYERVMAFFRSHGFRVVVVAYVRDQPAWLNSWYTQDQRNFVSRLGPEEFLERAITNGIVDPRAFLDRPMRDGQVEVRVAPFERAVKQGLARSFFELIGVPASFEVEEPKPSNANIGVKGVWAAQEIMRRVDGGVRGKANYAQLYESFKSMMRVKDWERIPYVGYTTEEAAGLRDRYRPTNDAFAREWFGCDWEEACPPRAMTRRVFDFEAASPEDQQDVIDVVERMTAMIEASPRLTQADRLARSPVASGVRLAERGAKPGAGKRANKGKGRRRRGPEIITIN